MASRTRSLIELKLSGRRTLNQLVNESRKRNISWRKITHLIYAETGVLISSETLRLWFKETDRKSA